METYQWKETLTPVIGKSVFTMTGVDFEKLVAAKSDYKFAIKLHKDLSYYDIVDHGENYYIAY